MMPTVLPTPDEIEAVYEQGKTAVSALFEKQACLIRDLEAKIQVIEDELAKNTRNSSNLPSRDGLINYQGQTLLDERANTDQDQPALNEQSRSLSQAARLAGQIDEGQLVINQGAIYWVPLDVLSGSELGIRHPYVVIQENVLNHSRINTVVVCALTSNIKRVSIPGNVLLDAGEANLPRQSVVEVSKVSTVHKTQLGPYIGSLTEERTNQILAGMRFLQRSFFAQ